MGEIPYGGGRGGLIDGMGGWGRVRDGGRETGRVVVNTQRYSSTQNKNVCTCLCCCSSVYRYK